MSPIVDRNKLKKKFPKQFIQHMQINWLIDEVRDRDRSVAHIFLGRDWMRFVNCCMKTEDASKSDRYFSNMYFSLWM